MLLALNYGIFEEKIFLSIKMGFFGNYLGH
jgi:hypothetical protein